MDIYEAAPSQSSRELPQSDPVRELLGLALHGLEVGPARAGDLDQLLADRRVEPRVGQSGARDLVEVGLGALE